MGAQESLRLSCLWKRPANRSDMLGYEASTLPGQMSVPGERLAGEKVRWPVGSRLCLGSDRREGSSPYLEGLTFRRCRADLAALERCPMLPGGSAALPRVARHSGASCRCG